MLDDYIHCNLPMTSHDRSQPVGQIVFLVDQPMSGRDYAEGSVCWPIVPLHDVNFGSAAGMPRLVRGDEARLLLQRRLVNRSRRCL
jgi:hypothetical protein